MNHRKKWAGAAVAAFVALGMLGAAAPANATGGNQTITVEGNSASARTLRAVQIAGYEHVLISDGAVDTFSLATINGDIKDAVLEYLKSAAPYEENGQGEYLSGYKEADHGDPIEWLAREGYADDTNWYDSVDDPSVRGLANYLAANLTGGLDWKDATAGTFSDLTQGLYLILDADEGTVVGQHSLPLIIGTKFDGVPDTGQPGETPLGTINIKGDLVKIDKDIVSGTGDARWLNGNTDWNSSSEPEDSATANQGDTVEFVIRTRVPNYPESSYDADTVKFDIIDTYTFGLSPNDDLAVWYADSPDAESWTLATGLWSIGDDVRATDGNPGTFTVRLSGAGITKMSGKYIQVRYTATVTAGTLKTPTDTYTQDINKAQVKFTDLWNNADGATENGQGAGGTDETAEDKTYVYTFPFEILKQDMAAPHAALNGVMFQLTRIDAYGKVVKSPSPSNHGPSVTGTVPWGDGQVVFTGLDAGEWYVVTETGVPNGWSSENMNRTPFAFQVTFPLTDGTEEGAPTSEPTYKFASFTYNAVEKTYEILEDMSPETTQFVDVGADATDHKVTVKNVKNAADMPSTGGQILLIVGIAGALGLGAITFGAVGLRKRKTLAAAAA